MADDTREQQSSVEDGLQEQEIRRPRRKPKPKHEFPQTQAGKMWDAFGNPDEPINTMPGGKFNSAGGRPPEVTWRDAFIFTRKDADNLFSGNFAKFPCARDSLLVGMGGGAAFGGLNFIVSGVRSLNKAANFAVGGACLTAAGMYTWCESRRKEEAQGMALAVAGMKKLHEKQDREKAAEEAAEKEAARVAEVERIKNQRWYKFW